MSYTISPINSDGEDEIISQQHQHQHNRKIVVSIATSITQYYASRIPKMPFKKRRFSGAELIKEILDGNPRRCYDKLRMKTTVFYEFCDLLSGSYGLKEVGSISTIEQVAHFLQYVGQGHSQRHLAEEYQHSTWTIHRSIRAVLKACLRMSKDWIRLFRLHNITPPEIEEDDRYSRYFQDCVGAIDGTHIDAVLPPEKQIPFIGRKGKPTQNIMATCDFNLCFTFVAAGWEGAAHDSRVLNTAINNPNSGFQFPPQGKYYLVDSGYANKNYFLAPYRKERYHLPDFQRNPILRNGREFFNYKHSSLRSSIERSFGIWKKKFKLVTTFPSPLRWKTQIRFVIATMALHNFIRIMNMDDPDFETEVGEYDDQDPDTTEDSSGNRDNRMDALRDSIRLKMEADRI